jgi:MraZ protein
MFLGEYQHTLDAKGRVSLPAKFRGITGEKVVVTKGFEGCLYVFPADGYTDFLGKLLDGNDFNRKTRDVRRFFLAGAAEVNVDSAGRIPLTGPLRDYAGLGKDVTVTGNGDRIEVWDSATWAAYQREVGGTVEDAAEELADQGIL